MTFGLPITPRMPSKKLANIGKSLDRFVKKETMSEEQKAEILDRISTTTILEKKP